MPHGSNSIRHVKFPDSWRNPDHVGYGTYPGPYRYEGIERYYAAVGSTLSNGYRHIDTAHTYVNEHYLGQAIQESGIPREDIFLTSKLHPDLNSFSGTQEGVEKSLANLRTDYLDLFLIHYPGVGHPGDAWRALHRVRETGLCKHIGVSNFEIKHLKRLREISGVFPEVNQIEFHPLLYSEELEALVQFCRTNDIQVEGYCPLAWADTGLLESETVAGIVRKYHCTPVRVILQWSMQHGVCPIAGTLSPDHMAENAGPYDFDLTPDDMSAIDNLGNAQIRLSIMWGWDSTKVPVEMVY